MNEPFVISPSPLLKFLKMSDRGCFSYIVGGTIKGIIIGGILGALGGLATRQSSRGVIITAMQGAQFLGIVKLIIGALLC